MATTVITVWDTITSTIAHAVDGVLTVLQHLIWAMQAFADGVNGVWCAAWAAWRRGRSPPPDSGSPAAAPAPQLAYARAVPVPALASGAVIPPNRAFLALLGDQRSGTNVEAPLATIQQAVAEVMTDVQAGQMAGFETLAALLQNLLTAVDGIQLTDEMVGRAAVRWTRRSQLQQGGVTV